MRSGRSEHKQQWDVSAVTNQLPGKPSSITWESVHRTVAIDPVWSALHHLRGRAVRGCFRGKRRQTADHTEKGKNLAQRMGRPDQTEGKKTQNPLVPSASPLWSSHGTVGHKTGDERERYFCICSPPSSAMYIGSVHPVFLTQGTDGVIFEYKMSFHLLCHKKKK